VGTAPSANVAAPQPASAVPVPDSRVKLARYALLAFVLFLGWRFCSWCGSCFTPSPEEPSGAAGPAAPDHAVEEPGAERDAARRSHATLDAGDVWLEYYAEPDASETAMDMAKKAPRTSALEKNRELLEEETRRRAHKRVDEESKQFEKIMGKEIKDEIRRELHKQVDQNLGKDPDQPKPKPTQ
jgi:hypothetical protein